MKIEKNISFKEYLVDKNFRKNFLKKLAIYTILLALFSSITIGSVSFEDILIFFTSMFVVGIIIIFIFNRIIYLKRYILLRKKHQLKYDMIFYENYFKIIKKDEIHKVEYQEIKAIKEETNFMILFFEKGKIRIEKNECEKKLIDLIRYLKYQKEEKLLENKSYQNIKKKMKFLFIFTILSLWFAFLSVSLITELLSFLIDTKYMWIMWLWLPIPITSIILGFKYKHQGLKCLKNIIGGFIIAALLMIYGCFIFIPTNEVNYEKISKLEKTLNINLPDTGRYYQNKIETSNSKNTIIHDIYFTNKKEYNIFEQKLLKDQRFILKKDLKSQLELLIPSNMTCQEKYTCYYAVYIKEIERYNTLPEKSGTYHMYILSYVFETHQLRIKEYTYQYKI